MKTIPAIYQFALMVVGIATASFFVYRWADNQNEKDKALMEAVTEIKNTVDYINIEQAFMADDIIAIHDTLERMEDDGKAREQKIETIAWGLKHMKQFTPEQFEDILDEMLKKNERLTPSVIEMNYPRYEIAQPEARLIPSSMK